MHWMNPIGAWAFTALAAILCLYILKQRMEPMEVSSTYLWQKALASMEADRPFQRLRRNLLLFLQLLLALLLAIGIMRPMTIGGESGEVIFVFDISASMQADAGDGTRLDQAIEDARRRIDGMPDGARISVLTAGTQVKQAATRTGDLQSAKQTIEGLAAENGRADMEGALSLAFALQRELEEVALVIYTDQLLPEGDFIQPALGTGLANRALLSLNATDTAAVARVANHSDNATQATLECYADGTLVDIRTVSLAAREVASVQFDLPAPASHVEARLTDTDALAADNTRIWTRRDTDVTTVVLAGENNIFLEKVLALRQDISVLKTTAEEAAAVKAGALTIIDGNLPETLPNRGALLLVNPDAYVGAQIQTPTTLSPATGALAETLNEYAQVDEIQVGRYRPVTVGTPVWMANGVSVLSILEENGQRIAIIGFDLHDSNLPLLKEFPVFMQRLMAYLAPEPLGAGFADGECGSHLQITPQSFAESAAVITPSGRRVDIPVTGGTLVDTNDIGVYSLVQTDDEGNETRIQFALHIPAAESDVSQMPQGRNETAAQGRGTTYGREWTPWVIALLIVVTLLEWWVYRRGY